MDTKKLKFELENLSEQICGSINNSDGWYVEPDKFHELSVFEKRLIKSIVRHIIENSMYDWIKEKLEDKTIFKI